MVHSYHGGLNMQGTLDPLRWARYYAAVQHGSQMYAAGHTYMHHLEEVERVLRRHGIVEQAMLEAAWLHDVIEDTRGRQNPVKRKNIAEMFGTRTADLVAAVTNDATPDHDARAAKTYPRIRACPGAVALKLADRIVNVSAGGELGGKYAAAYEDFYRALHTVGEHEEMWAELDTLLGVTR
jgi:(p)ppGpp synthase/HD superfamily hydrolase